MPRSPVFRTRPQGCSLHPPLQPVVPIPRDDFFGPWGGRGVRPINKQSAEPEPTKTHWLKRRRTTATPRTQFSRFVLKDAQTQVEVLRPGGRE
ncbi:hypothetical protein FKM82_011021 [Ascaphus truei]